MEFIQQISNNLEHDLGVTDNLIEIKIPSGKKSNQEIILKQTAENIQQTKQIICDKTIQLEKIKEKNKILIFQIEYENQWRNRIIKRLFETVENIKTVNSNTTLIKNLITNCINEQTQINQVKEQLLKYTEKENVASNKQTQQNDELIKKLEDEKLNMIKFKKQFKIQSTNIDDKIDMKKLVIDSLKQKINALKFKNIMAEYKNNAVISEVAIISSKLNIINLNWKNIKTAQNNVVMNENINSLNESCEKNMSYIINLEKKSDKLKNEIKTADENLREMTIIISELNKNISNYDEKHEILYLKEIYKSDKREFERKKQILKLKINKKQHLVVEKENKNKILNQEFLDIKNKLEFTKSKNNELNQTSQCLKYKLMEKENNLKELKTIFKNKLKTLKTHIKENNSINSINKELQLLDNKITELKKQYEIELKNYNLINETWEHKTTKLIETKHLLEIKLQEVKIKIEEQQKHFEERNKQLERENEIKFANFKEQTRIYKKEILRVNEVNEKNRNKKLERIKEINSNKKLQLFGLKTKKLNLSKDLDMRIKEINKNQDKPNNNFKHSLSDCESSEDSIIVTSKRLKKVKRKRKTVRKAKNIFKAQKRCMYNFKD